MRTEDQFQQIRKYANEPYPFSRCLPRMLGGVQTRLPLRV